MKNVEEKFYAENQAIAQLLFEKGFTLFTIKMALCVGLDKKDEAGEKEGQAGQTE